MNLFACGMYVIVVVTVLQGQMNKNAAQIQKENNTFKIC